MEVESDRLISLVFLRRALWDKTSKQYRDRLCVNSLWHQVAAELGVNTTYAVKKKWKNLRDAFGKELRKFPVAKSEEGDPLNIEKYTTWPHFESMLFLKDQMKPRKYGGNLSARGAEDDSEDVAVESEESNGNDYSNVFEINYLEEPPFISSTQSQTSSQQSNRSVKRSSIQQLVEIEAKKMLLEQKVNKSTADDDEDEAFFKSLLPHVRKLMPEEKLEFRMDVQSLVQNYVYKRKKDC
ncbi:transcription factor Adf-1-like isoform X2 [Toxorhynchites rutilus septentrionalis]|uniref:transcription factor Adf-1-like isoform X2 n=1 Tax=Toxorhynchites rutilus septentrionalis TaxID=329112 RepID=UPI002479BAFD|nr:transcription factor Adf-1-like isoform X2 [Toxorhynchites rutilus septentrionalis]